MRQIAVEVTLDHEDGPVEKYTYESEAKNIGRAQSEAIQNAERRFPKWHRIECRLDVRVMTLEERAESSPVRIFARVTEQGTACPETALCSIHYASNANRKVFGNPDHIHFRDAPTGSWHDCTANETLSCVVCGWSDREAQ